VLTGLVLNPLEPFDEVFQASGPRGAVHSPISTLSSDSSEL